MQQPSSIKRDQTLDIVKGICIVLMVLGHASFPFTKFVYLFHMAAFIIISGYLFKFDSTRNITTTIQLIKKRIVGLYVPYVFLNMFFLLCVNQWLGINLTTLTKGHIIREIMGILSFGIFGGGQKLAGATWYLMAIFETEIFWTIIFFVFTVNNTVKKEKIIQFAFIASIIFILLFWFYDSTNYEVELFGITIFDKLRSILLFSFPFILGLLMKEKNILNRIRPSVSLIMVSFFGLVLLNMIGEIELVQEITNPFFYIASTILGFNLIYCIAIILKEKKLGRLLAFVGKNTLVVLMWHFLFFRIVVYLQTGSMAVVRDIVTYFPTYKTDHGWWILYSLFGIVFPILINSIRKNIIALLNERRK